jgi:molybdate transport system substrate-binding protein
MIALAIGASAAVSLASAPAHAQFTIGVAANFGATLNDLLTTYAALNGLDPGSFPYQVDSTANLKTCITSPSTTNCPIGPYDLFLAADSTTPEAVSTYGMTYPPTITTPIPPFFYATGSLELYSKSVDISAGLPSEATLVPLVIAKPSAAPYGFAAMTVINTYGYSFTPLSTTSSYPVASLIYTEPNILLTYEAIGTGTNQFAYGFIHKSAICRVVNGTETFPSGIFYHEYVYSASDHPYPEIVQSGIPIEESTQTDATKAQILDFINYLQGTAYSGVGTTIIQSYCYGTTPPS